MSENKTPNFGQNGHFGGENVRPMRQPKKVPVFQIIFGILIILFLMFGSSFFFVVNQDEVAVVKVFNETKKIIVDEDNDIAQVINDADTKFNDIEIINGKGIFFKIPFITTVETYSSKLQTYVSAEEQVTTSDKVKFQVALYAQWEITHPALFETNYGNIVKASNRIDETLYADIINLINEQSSDDFLTNKTVLYEALEEKRNEYNEKNKGTGINIQDLEIYRVSFPQSNLQSIYTAMEEERYKAAAEIRAEGSAFLISETAKVDTEVETILAKAEEESKTLIGKTDAEVIRIYAQAFAANPKFYEFWRTLKAYEESIDEETTIYLDKNNPFLKYITSFDIDTIQADSVYNDEFNNLFNNGEATEETTDDASDETTDEATDETTDETTDDTTEE